MCALFAWLNGNVIALLILIYMLHQEPNKGMPAVTSSQIWLNCAVNDFNVDVKLVAFL